MKINKSMGAAALALAVASSAHAAQNVYITGSTAFRSQIYAALVDLGLTLSTSSSTSTAGNNSEFYSGSITASTLAGQPVLSSGSFNVYCAFTGSSEGVNAIADPFDATTNSSPPYVNASGTFINQTADLGDIAMCDVLQSSTPYANSSQLYDVPSFDQNGKGTGGMAVVPFTFATTGYGLAHGITNVNPFLAYDLWSEGKVPLSFWTGNTSDTPTNVFAVGRTNDSGTRITMQLLANQQTGSLNTANPLKQYALGSSGGSEPGIGVSGTPPVPNGLGSAPYGTQWNLVNNDGYASGGNIAKVLGAAPATAANGCAIGYVSWSDASSLTAAGGGSGGGAGNGAPLNFAGISPTTVALTSWTGGASGTPWNTNAIENGSYPFWSYEHMYEPAAVGGNGGTVDNFASDLVNGVLQEIHNYTASSIQTAFRESDLNVYRGSDGGDIKHN
jgi:hypothetical protein